MKAPRLIPCAILSLAVAAGAQQPSSPAPPAPPSPPPPACQEPRFRQFDFWLGSWTIFNPKEQPSGLNEITRIAGGCAIQERWQGVTHGAGTSMSFFDPADSAWHQIWVGDDGTVLHLKGGLQEGAMVMTGGDRKTPRGTVRDRLLWMPQADGGVLQEWEISTDGGKTWQKSFSGRYRKR